MLWWRYFSEWNNWWNVLNVSGAKLQRLTTQAAVCVSEELQLALISHHSVITGLLRLMLLQCGGRAETLEVHHILSFNWSVFISMFFIYLICEMYRGGRSFRPNHTNSDWLPSFFTQFHICIWMRNTVRFDLPATIQCILKCASRNLQKYLMKYLVFPCVPLSTSCMFCIHVTSMRTLQSQVKPRWWTTGWWECVEKGCSWILQWIFRSKNRKKRSFLNDMSNVSCVTILIVFFFGSQSCCFSKLSFDQGRIWAKSPLRYRAERGTNGPSWCGGKTDT